MDGDAISSSYAKNATIDDLVSQLFVEDWKSSYEYGRYFTACAPQTCSYSYTEQANIANAITTILGLYGGLNVVLRWLLPPLVKRGRQILDYIREKRRNRLTPIVNPLASSS